MSDDGDDIGALWRDVRAASQAKRAHNRSCSAAILRSVGLRFATKNHGAHLVVGPVRELMIDFWPGTGRWIVRDATARGIGVRNLLRYLEITE